MAQGHVRRRRTEDRPRWKRAADSGDFYVEFRVKAAERKFRWLAGKGQVPIAAMAAACCAEQSMTSMSVSSWKRGSLRLNETLETRVGELREEARALEVLNRTGVAIGAELDLERLVQTITDAGRRT